MKLAVVGSRGFKNDYLLTTILDNIMAETEITEIVSGGAKGADSLAEMYAKGMNIKIKIFPVDWNDMTEPCLKKRNSRGQYFNALSGHNRNTKIVEHADKVIAFWDGKSPGTKNTIDKAKKLNKLHSIVLYEENQ